MSQQDYSYPARHQTSSNFAKRLSIKSSKKLSSPHSANNNNNHLQSLPKWNDYYANGGDSSSNPNLIKVVVIGESGAGKSNLIQRLTEDRFDARSKSTIGIDFALYEFTEPASLRPRSTKYAPAVYKAQIWDTAGQERYRSSMTKIFYRDVAGALLVCDLTNRDHFFALNRWLDEIRSNVHHSADSAAATHLPSPHQIPILLVGNKVDEAEHRQIAPADGMDFVRRHRLVDYVETSAKTGANVEKAFNSLFEHILLQRARAEEEAQAQDKKRGKTKAGKTTSRKGLQRESSIKLGYTNAGRGGGHPTSGYQSPPRQKKHSKCSC